MIDPSIQERTTIVGETAYQVERGPYLRRGVTWGAIWAGAFVTVAVEAMLTVLMIGVFASFIHPATGTMPSGTEYAGGIAAWLFVETVVATYFGGWISGRLSTRFDRGINALQAWVVWSIATVVFFSLAVAPAIQGTMAVVRSALVGVSVGTVAVNVATWLPIFVFVTLIVSLFAALAGGRAGTVSERLD